MTIAEEYQRRPKLLLPFLAPFYESVRPLSWAILRICFGTDLAIHGWEKVVRLPRIIDAIAAGTTAALPAQFDPTHNIILAFFEFVGGISIAVGLFTRFFAAASAIELAIICFTVFWPHSGYHGAEYTFWWGIVMFVIALRGGGPYSLDRAIGREL